MTLKITPSDVVATLGELPDTVHPLDDPSKFVFDTCTMPGFLAPIAAGVDGETVLFAIVHGEFTERAQLLSLYCVLGFPLFDGFLMSCHLLCRPLERNSFV